MKIITNLLLTMTLLAPNVQTPEWEVASAFLGSRNIHPSEISVPYESSRCIYFSAPADSAFVLVAKGQYKSILGSQILAYGTGEDVWLREKGEEKSEHDVFFENLINGYERTLAVLDNAGTLRKTGKGLTIAPMLKGIYYGQHLPYNQLFPKDGTGDGSWYSVVGCGPVALAQTLTYYKAPVQLEGIVSGKTLRGYPYTYNLADYPVDWTQLNAPALLLDCALSIGTKMGTGYSLSRLAQLRNALVGSWNYDPGCKMLNSNYAEPKQVELIYAELAAARPVLLAGNNHIFTCDGCEGDFLHLDFGWKGYGNGYYRALLATEAPEWQLPFDQIIIGIQPAKGIFTEKVVKLSKAGTLAKKLPEKERRFVRKLTISGPVNGDDIDLIRRLSGAVITPEDLSNGYGALQELDLSGAKLVAGGAYHLNPGKMVIAGSIPKENAPAYEYRFDLGRITADDWKMIMNLGLNKTYQLQMVKNTVLIARETQDNVVTSYLFADAIGLRHIALPKSTVQVETMSFPNCSGLREVSNLPANVAPDAFLTTFIFEQ